MFTTLLATHDGWGHGPGPWILVPLTFLLLWVAVIALVAWRIRRAGPPWARHGAHAVLAERFARGDVTADEYRERRAVLREEGDR